MIQDPVLFTGTIASNIAYGNPDATREEIEHAARMANCDFIWTMPQGFETIGEYCLQISSHDVEHEMGQLVGRV
jgi:ABC-type multidrug transport system fused ATPase/permease subunit